MNSTSIQNNQFNCDQFVCDNACQNGGTCVGPNKCQCPAGWTGAYCSQFTCDVLECGTNAICTGPNVCSCTGGYLNRFLPTPCSDSACLQLPCSLVRFDCFAFSCSVVNNNMGCGNQAICTAPAQCMALPTTTAPPTTSCPPPPVCPTVSESTPRPCPTTNTPSTHAASVGVSMLLVDTFSYGGFVLIAILFGALLKVFH
jgi:hypothetical protein